jgi:hypothetical protein
VARRPTARRELRRLPQTMPTECESTPTFTSTSDEQWRARRRRRSDRAATTALHFQPIEAQRQARFRLTRSSARSRLAAQDQPSRRTRLLSPRTVLQGPAPPN